MPIKYGPHRNSLDGSMCGPNTYAMTVLVRNSTKIIKLNISTIQHKYGKLMY